MAKFKFRLDTLLRLREISRDGRRQRLAQAYRADEILQQQQEQVKQQLAKLAEKCRRASGPGPVEIDRLLEAQRYEVVLRAHNQQTGQQRETVAVEIDRRHQTLVEANREVRVLEKLREKQLRRHREEENRQEVKQLDEVAGQLVAREKCR